jgi:hypothetical protein
MKPKIMQEMLQQLRPALKRPSKAEALLQEYCKNRIAIIWNTNDVHRAANEKEMALTESEAIQVLQAVRHNYNPQHGLKWEDVTDYIVDRVLGRSLTKRELHQLVLKDVVTIQKNKKRSRR